MNSRITLMAIVAVLWACSGETKNDQSSPGKKTVKQEKKEEASDKGIGQTTHVELNDPLNMDMVDKGRAIYELKCAACHKLSDKRVVGPGWKGLTTKRTPEWIMNMITDVDIMLDEDPQAQKLLEECLTRMPNQNVSVEEAREILEFIYWNDQQS